MRRLITRGSAAVTAGVTLSALGVTGVSAAGAATQTSRQRPAAVHSLAVSGAQLWVKRYNGPGSGTDYARSVAVSPDGAKVYVTGSSNGATSGEDYATIAYNSTGVRLWVKRYNGPANGNDEARSVAVSPDGSKVYVTGASGGAACQDDYATIAYSAATGALLWVKRYNGPGNCNDEAYSVAVSPDGGNVYVTGFSYGGSEDYATIAYSAATGAQRWVKRYDGPPSANDEAYSVAVSPDGGKVYVTGTSHGATSNEDYATIAYSAATGARLWVKRYNGPANSDEEATSITAAGGNVYVTGWSWGGRSRTDYATVAYSSTGTRLWVRRYNDPRNGRDYARSVAVSPAGKVFVTGYSPGAGTNEDYATIAYSATGTRLWIKRYNGPGNGPDSATSLAAPGNGRVYVTGQSGGGSATGPDYATVAYDAITGAQLWVRRYNGPGNGTDGASSLAARSGRVFVVGLSTGTTSGLDYATVAYSG